VSSWRFISNSAGACVGLAQSKEGNALVGAYDLEFDVVVAGAGSAGCVLASRLTQNSEISLCLIEAGGRDSNPWIHIPLGFGKLVPECQCQLGL
jgi:hypothetical protein